MEGKKALLPTLYLILSTLKGILHLLKQLILLTTTIANTTNPQAPASFLVLQKDHIKSCVPYNGCLLGLA